MIEVNEQLAEVISNSLVAFINGQMAEAFKLAKEAIKLDENCADAYQCAANVCMSLSRYEDAIEYYQKAVNCDPNNGNRFFSLGYAQASVNKIAEAMQNFAKADELGLNEDAAGQMYHILGIVNQEFRKLDDALINLKKSELIIPADMDILKRKAVIYGLLDEIISVSFIINSCRRKNEITAVKVSGKILLLDEMLNIMVTLNDHRKRGSLHSADIQLTAVTDGEQPRAVHAHKPVCFRPGIACIEQAVISGHRLHIGERLADSRLLKRGYP